MFEPNNEMGVVVYFAQIANQTNYDIVSIQAAFPDAVIRDVTSGKEYRVEFEYWASNFIAHRHDVRNCDLIICWVNDLDEQFPLTIWELSSMPMNSFSVQDVAEDQKEIAYLRSENKYLRRQINKQRSETDYEIVQEGPGERALLYIEQVRANENGRTPGQSEIARAAQVSKSTADAVLRKMQ